MATSRGRTTKKKVESYEVAMPLLNAIYDEFKAFSKKKPDGALSKNKIAVVNRLLEKCRAVLQSEPSFEFLDLFDEDDLPQNSDVVLMLSQYVAAMQLFKEAYWRWDNLEWNWCVSD